MRQPRPTPPHDNGAAGRRTDDHFIGDGRHDDARVQPPQLVVQPIEIAEAANDKEGRRAELWNGRLQATEAGMGKTQKSKPYKTLTLAVVAGGAPTPTTAQRAPVFQRCT